MVNMGDDREVRIFSCRFFNSSKFGIIIFLVNLIVLFIITKERPLPILIHYFQKIASAFYFPHSLCVRKNMGFFSMGCRI